MDRRVVMGAVVFVVAGALLVVMGMSAGPSWGWQSGAAQAVPAETRAGWISDEACGAEHTKPGKADCVEKCWRGGAAVGHPEWKPQRAVFVADDTKTIWVVENAEAVKKFPAVHVRVSGKFDAEKNSVQVETVEAVK